MEKEVQVMAGVALKEVEVKEVEVKKPTRSAASLLLDAEDALDIAKVHLSEILE